MEEEKESLPAWPAPIALNMPVSVRTPQIAGLPNRHPYLADARTTSTCSRHPQPPSPPHCLHR